ncbi:MAG: hypothetical protein LC733_04380 [Actinobacteria bacterium]|nr:hypothetical protein [Actinomycetota bacterium]
MGGTPATTPTLIRSRARQAAGLGLAVVLAACGSNGGQAEDDPLAPAPGGSGAVPGTYGPPRLLGNLADLAITESSGLVASRRNPGVYWTHNDSGDDPVVFCVRGRGEACGAWRVTGAQARDWEAIAAGPGPEQGTSYLYVGDIGDNLEDLQEVLVYRVPEPSVPASGTGPARGAPASTDEAETLRLRYPDGPHNAEALAVHPQTGDLYVVVKAADPAVYVARAPLTAAPVTLELVGTVTVPDPVPALKIVTGADIAPDGRRVAVCTYGDGYELELPADEPAFDAIWRQPARRVDLGDRAQGESIAYRLDGRALLTTSEQAVGLPVPLLQVERRP